MSAQNRAARIQKLVTALKKQFKPVTPSKDRTLLENLLFACLLENSHHDAAERAYDTLREEYFGWNEVRVSTRRELAEVMKGLNDPDEAADRLKRSLHSVFESVYEFDIEPLKKQNLGQAVKQLQSYKGVDDFVVAYATQNSLGGHSIPVNRGLLIALRTLDIISEAEADAGTAPGLERAVPKSKGIEVGSLLHQLGVEVGKNPYGQNARKLLLAIDPECKDRLPKRPQKPAPKAAEEDVAARAKSTAKKPAAKSAAKKKAAAPAADKKGAQGKKAASSAGKKAKTGAKKTPGKKVAKKKPAKKQTRAKRKPK